MARRALLKLPCERYSVRRTTMFVRQWTSRSIAGEAVEPFAGVYCTQLCSVYLGKRFLPSFSGKILKIRFRSLGDPSTIDFTGPGLFPTVEVPAESQ